MRWIKKYKPVPHLGDIRFIWKFLWLPTTIGSVTRWLEHASIKQECYLSYDVPAGSGLAWTFPRWKNIEWMSY